MRRKRWGSTRERLKENTRRGRAVVDCARCGRGYEDSFDYCPHCGREKATAPGHEQEARPAGSAAPAGAKSPRTGAVEASQRLSPLGWRQLITVLIAVLAVFGWVLAGVVLKAGPESDETATEAVAEKLIESVTGENYRAVLDLADRGDDPLLGLMLSESAGRKPESIQVEIEAGDLLDEPLALEFAETYLPRTRKNLLKSNIRSLNSRKLVPGKNYLVAIFSAGSDEAFPVIMVNSGGGWGVDLAAMLLMANGGASARYVIDSVEELLSDAGEDSAEKAVSVLEAAEGLQEKYELWLEPEAESLLSGELVSVLNENRRLTGEFEGLLSEAEEARRGSRARRPVPGETGETASPPSTEVITVSGTGGTVSEPFELGQGLTVLHFRDSGPGPLSITLVDGSGRDVAVFRDESPATVGSRALSVPPGLYTLKVESAGSWSVGIEEPAPVSVPVPPLVFSAGGQLASGFFQVRGGPVVLEMNYAAAGEFVVTVMEFGGSAVYLAANETGPFDGSRSVPLRSEVYYLLDVKADGPWTIQVR